MSEPHQPNFDNTSKYRPIGEPIWRADGREVRQFQGVSGVLYTLVGTHAFPFSVETVVTAGDGDYQRGMELLGRAAVLIDVED